MTATLHADWVYVDGRMHRDFAVAIGDDGRIVSVGPSASHDPGERLEGRALMPALVNAHSHAFQRVLRGRTEQVPGSADGDDFWSWRERMYRAATELHAEEIEAASLWAFVEMAKAGVGTVVEFHYVHHDRDGAPYDDVSRLDERVARAALQAGLRVTMLRVVYERGGFGRPAEPRQRRFVDPTVQDALARTHRLAERLADAPLCRVGIAPHSVRAVSRPWLEAIGDEVHAQGWVCHVHVSEQTAEVQAAREAHGLTPVGILDAAGVLGDTTTLVHAIHLDDRDFELIGRSGAAVCACPTTEANLGDGIVEADRLRARGVPVALGSDSHANIDLLAEGRCLENHLRLLRQRRNVLTVARGPDRRCAPAILDAATVAGAHAAGWPGGAVIAAGAPADLMALDLRASALVGCTDDPDALAAAVALAAGAREVTDTWVAGRRVLQDGVHPLQREAATRFENVQRRLWS